MRKGAHFQPKDPKDCLIDDLQEIVERRTGSKLTRPQALNRTDAQRLLLALQTSDATAALDEWRQRRDMFRANPFVLINKGENQGTIGMALERRSLLIGGYQVRLRTEDGRSLWATEDEILAFVEEHCERFIVAEPDGSHTVRHWTGSQDFGPFVTVDDAKAKIDEEEAWLKRMSPLINSLGKETISYSVELQQDRTWAVMAGGGFVKGGFATRGEAVFFARKLIKDDRETGQPAELVEPS